MEPKDPDLDQLLKKWQPILRLQDWNVEIKYDRLLVHDGKAGDCKRDWEFKDARIRILPSDCMDPDWLGDMDIEITVVHELLHLHSVDFDRELKRESPHHGALERMIETTARALVKLDRK